MKCKFLTCVMCMNSSRRARYFQKTLFWTSSQQTDGLPPWFKIRKCQSCWRVYNFFLIINIVNVSEYKYNYIYRSYCSFLHSIISEYIGGNSSRRTKKRSGKSGQLTDSQPDTLTCPTPKSICCFLNLAPLCEKWLTVLFFQAIRRSYKLIMLLLEYASDFNLLFERIFV